MNIRTRLTLLFFVIVIVILTVASIAIYFFSSDYREEDFYRRLRSKAENTAKLLIEVDEVDLELLKRIEANNPINLPNERITILNNKNQELYSSDHNDSLKIDIRLLNRIRLDEEIRFRNGDTEVLGFLFTDNDDRFTVVASAIDIHGLRKLKNLKNILFIIFPISLLIVSISGWIYAGRAMRPIARIVRKVDNISAARLDLRLEEGNGTDELAQLANTFNKMLSRLETAFIAQKNFIANASHELRTPVTAIAGEIEVTLMMERTKEQYVTVLKSILEDAKNLNALTSQLLLLAQTSSDAYDHQFTNVRLDEALWSAKEDLEKAHPDYTIHIEFDLKLNEESFVISGDEQLLKVVFMNLMDNACKYSNDGRVHVVFTLRSNDIVIEFINSGKGIEAKDLQSIFEPFYRGKNTHAAKGHGIGLSLASRVMRLHNGFIEVRSEPGKITCFTITFPFAKSKNRSSRARIEV